MIVKLLKIAYFPYSVLHYKVFEARFFYVPASD